MMMAEMGDHFTISGEQSLSSVFKANYADADVSPSSSAFEYIENYQKNSGGPGDDLEKSRFLNKELAEDIADNILYSATRLVFVGCFVCRTACIQWIHQIHIYIQSNVLQARSVHRDHNSPPPLCPRRQSELNYGTTMLVRSGHYEYR